MAKPKPRRTYRIWIQKDRVITFEGHLSGWQIFCLGCAGFKLEMKV